MQVSLISHTENPEGVVASAAKLCYSNTSAKDLISILDSTSTSKLISKLNSYGHQSPLEHASFTFSIGGVSRSLLAQITRHRIASFSVQSQRYVSQENTEYVVPKEISDCKDALDLFNSTMCCIQDAYRKITDILYNKYLNCLGHEASESEKNTLKKKAIENARAVLPNACETEMVVTMNARELRHFFELRCCNRAQDEIKELATHMYCLVYRVAPNLFATAGPSCTRGVCNQGKMCCGKCEEMIKKFSDIRIEVDKYEKIY